MSIPDEQFDQQLGRILGMTPQEIAEKAAANRRYEAARKADLDDLLANYQAVADFYVNRELEPVGVRLVFEFEADRA